MSIKAVRGAVSVEKDTPENIKEAVNKMVYKLIDENVVSLKKIVTIHFSLTPDLHSMNPAAALRHGEKDFSTVPLFVAQEPVVQNSLPAIIRVLITYKQWGFRKPRPVYLGEAEKLRPDLVSKD